MDDSGRDFLSQLGRGPAVLLLGQRHLTMESGHDPLLAQIAKKYGAGPLTSYTGLLELGLASAAESALAWMDERCQRLSPAEGTETLAEYPWSSVVTSAIDTIWPRAFRRSWREIQPVLDERQHPADPRNRARLHCLFLYGNLNRLDPRERVPLTPFERLKRDQIAVSLSRRIPDLVTPLGVLAIEGYGGAEDWLQPGHLAPILADLSVGQVHVFGVGEELANDPMLKELYRLGIAVTHSASLASTIADGIAAGHIKAGPLEEGGGSPPDPYRRVVAAHPRQSLEPRANVGDRLRRCRTRTTEANFRRCALP